MCFVCSHCIASVPQDMQQSTLKDTRVTLSSMLSSNSWRDSTSRYRQNINQLWMCHFSLIQRSWNPEAILFSVVRDIKLFTTSLSWDALIRRSNLSARYGPTQLSPCHVPLTSVADISEPPPWRSWRGGLESCEMTGDVVRWHSHNSPNVSDLLIAEIVTYIGWFLRTSPIKLDN